LEELGNEQETCIVLVKVIYKFYNRYHKHQEIGDKYEHGDTDINTGATPLPPFLNLVTCVSYVPCQ
jgi:hypothetical protein